MLRTLNQLKEQESGIIVNVRGEGALRHRIVEMGFVAGTKVTSLKKAPLQNPVDYSLMGYNVSLRQEEALLIDIVSEADYHKDLHFMGYHGVNQDKSQTTASSSAPHTTKDKDIRIALVGNPNSGKTSLFNFASHSRERVGNYSGVTVGAKTARFKQEGYTFHIVDLPGTYSITHYTPEELYVKNHIIDERPDVVINVIDASNLERNLYLTTQLIDMGVKVVIALNMYDELTASGDLFDFEHLGKMIGMPMVPTVAYKGKGINDLFSTVIAVHTNKHPFVRPTKINYGQEIEQHISRLQNLLSTQQIKTQLPLGANKRSIAIKLLEGDSSWLAHGTYQGITHEIEKAKEELTTHYQQSAETSIADARYAFIKGALHECYKSVHNGKHSVLNSIDKVLLNTFLAIPIFLGFMWLMFWATFTLGAYPMEWIEQGVGALGGFVQQHMPNGMLKDMIVDGIIGGVGGVIVFLPNILILFLFISIMEDTGYMARVAFIMDKIMHKIGLHGRSFIPLMMGFGCNVPAIMATRTIQNRNDRLLTMLINPFMSCSARLPVYILFIGAFFPNHPDRVLFLIYIIGILLAALVAIVFKKVLFRMQESPFVMELPPYRTPTLRNVIKHMWFKARQYLQKMGGIILVASIIIWALSYFPLEHSYSQDYDSMIEAQSQQLTYTSDSITYQSIQAHIEAMQMAQAAEHQANSYLGRIGHSIEPALQPLGFDWRMGVSLLAGASAKEIVVSTLGILFQADGEAEDGQQLRERLKNASFTAGPRLGEKVLDPIVSFAFLIFVLIYFPCIATVAAIKKEAGSWKWAGFMMLYTTALAWILAFLINFFGHLIIQ